MTDVMTEKALLNSIVKAARDCGYLVYHTWSSIHSPRGLPDLVMVRENDDGTAVLLFVELKSERGKVSEPQQMWLDMLGKVPGIGVYLWRPADLETAYQILVAGCCDHPATPSR